MLIAPAVIVVQMDVSEEGAGSGDDTRRILIRYLSVTDVEEKKQIRVINASQKVECGRGRRVGAIGKRRRLSCTRVCVGFERT